MALVDVAESAGSYRGTVEIILRAARLGLFTAAEAGLLIDRVRPHTTRPLVSIQDSNPAGGIGKVGSLLIHPDRTFL